MTIYLLLNSEKLGPIVYRLGQLVFILQRGVRFPLGPPPNYLLMKYKISIIVPFYNSEKYLRKNFKTLFKIQKKITNAEIIYIDNNSIDNSYKFIKEKIVNLENIRLFKTLKKKGQGPGIGRNLGVKMSIGEYILFLDADDSLEIKNFKKLINFLSKNNSNIVYLKKKSDVNSAPFLEYNKKKLIMYFTKSSTHEVISILFKKEFLIKNKIFFLSKIYEDIFYLFKCHFFNNIKISYFSKVIYYKHFNKNSITNANPSLFRLKCKFYAWKNIDKFVRKNLNKPLYNKLTHSIQYWWRGHLTYEFINIQKSSLYKAEKKPLISWIVKNYRKHIYMKFEIITVKDKLTKFLLEQKN